MTGWLKFLLELGPLAVFFITFTIFAPKTAEPEHVAPDRPVLEQPAAESGAEGVASGEKALADAEAARFEAELDALILATIAMRRRSAPSPPAPSPITVMSRRSASGRASSVRPRRWSATGA